MKGVRRGMRYCSERFILSSMRRCIEHGLEQHFKVPDGHCLLSSLAMNLYLEVRVLEYVYSSWG